MYRVEIFRIIGSIHIGKPSFRTEGGLFDRVRPERIG
jgi:hypothetical protein